MNGRIEVGDLVYVAKWPCCGVAVGETSRVIGFEQTAAIWRCKHCKVMIPAGTNGLLEVNLPFKKLSVPLTWLRRIPPLSELETQDTKEEVPA